MSFVPSTRPTLPAIRDVFPDEFASKVDPPFNSPSLTQARPWRSDDGERAGPLSVQYTGVQSIYGSSFRYSNTEFRGSALLHSNHRSSHEHMVSIVQPDIHTFGSFFASPTHPHRVLPQYPFSANPANPRCSRSTSTDAQYVEAFEPTSVARCNSDASLAFTHQPSFTYGVQRERRNSSASYECPYCGKLFSRPSSLKIHSNSHTGEKPFACPVQDCGRSFSVLSNMRRHARSHSSYAVSLTESASDHYPLSLSSATSSNLGLSSPIESHRRYSDSTSGSSSTSRKKNCIFSQ